MFFNHDDNGLGIRGERRACRWLRRRGWKLLGRNLTIGRDEIDIIAESPDGRVVACIEVKSTRSSHADLFRRIDGAKRRCLRRSGRIIASRHPDQLIRIDLVTVRFGRLSRARVEHWPSVLEERSR